MRLYYENITASFSALSAFGADGSLELGGCEVCEEEPSMIAK